MKILVTGTAGFIASHVAIELIKRGDEVIGLDNINDYYDVNIKYDRLKKVGIYREKIRKDIIVKSDIHNNYRFIKANLGDKDTLNKLFEKEKFDVVCNLAAQAGVRYSLTNTDAYINSNIIGFVNIIEACRHNNVKHLVYASSSSVYGLNEKMPFQDFAKIVSFFELNTLTYQLQAYGFLRFTAPGAGRTWHCFYLRKPY